MYMSYDLLSLMYHSNAQLWPSPAVSHQSSSWDYGTFHPPWTHSSEVHAQPSNGARCLIFGQTRRLFPYFMCANSEGSGETARMCRLTWAFAGRLCDKYHISWACSNFSIQLCLLVCLICGLMVIWRWCGVNLTTLLLGRLPKWL